jgi:hypothetical protein
VKKQLKRVDANKNGSESHTLKLDQVQEGSMCGSLIEINELKTFLIKMEIRNMTTFENVI